MATSAGCGSLTLIIMSDRSKISLARADQFGPALGVVLIGEPEPRPAPTSTNTRCPARVNSSTPTGSNAYTILVTLNFFWHSNNHGIAPFLVLRGQGRHCIGLSMASQGPRCDVTELPSFDRADSFSNWELQEAIPVAKIWRFFGRSATEVASHGPLSVPLTPRHQPWHTGGGLPRVVRHAGQRIGVARRS